MRIDCTVRVMVFCVAICQPELQNFKYVVIFGDRIRVNGRELRKSYLDGERRFQLLKLEFHLLALNILFIVCLKWLESSY
jgi:hypothetical protein